MAKKFSKFLLFTTVAGAAAAGIYLYLKQKNDDPVKDFDDFDDDMSDFFEEDKKSNSEREYVSLDRSAATETASSSSEKVESEEPDDTEDE